MFKLYDALYKTDMHMCMRALVYNDLILAVLNECNLLFLLILLCFRLEDKSCSVSHKSSVTDLHIHIYYSLTEHWSEIDTGMNRRKYAYVPTSSC